MSKNKENDVKCAVINNLSTNGDCNVEEGHVNFNSIFEDRFKSIGINGTMYDVLLCDTKVGDIVSPSIIVLKHYGDSGVFKNITDNDFMKNIVTYFSNPEAVKQLISKYDFLPYSTTSKNFTINVREFLEKQISVRADSLGDALNKVQDMYKNGEIVLNADDFIDKEITSHDGLNKFYKYIEQVDLDSLKMNEEAKVLIPSYTGEMEWEKTPVIRNYYFENNKIQLVCDGCILTNDINKIIDNESPYVICKDKNTKDWYVYNNDTNKNECYFNNEFEAKDWCMNQITKGDYSVSQKHQKYVMSRR